MAIVSDNKKRDEDDESSASDGAPSEREPAAKLATDEDDEGPLSPEELEAQAALMAAAEQEQGEAEAAHVEDAPIVFGTQRFVFAAYFAGAIGAAFVASKALTGLWRFAAKYKPAFGEPKEELLYIISGAIGVATALYYWRRESARAYANAVAEELAKVTWPSKKEVQGSTTVVVATTLGAAVFFAVLDLMWRFVTDKIYGM
jgi:preprotein translocase subunit SecE